MSSQLRHLFYSSQWFRRNHPHPTGTSARTLDGAVISENGATKLREAEKPTDTFVNTHRRERRRRTASSWEGSVSLSRRCRYKDHSCHFAMTKLYPNFLFPCPPLPFCTPHTHTHPLRSSSCLPRLSVACSSSTSAASSPFSYPALQRETERVCQAEQLGTVAPVDRTSLRFFDSSFDSSFALLSMSDEYDARYSRTRLTLCLV